MAMPLFPLAFIEGVGGPEMGLILVIVLVLFGGKKLPEFARGLGKSMREFKKAASGVEQEFKRALEEEAPKPYTPPPPSSETTPDHPTGNEYHDYHHDESHAYHGEAGPTTPATVETPPVVPAVSDAPPVAPTATDLPKTDVAKSDPTPPPAATTPPPPPTPPVTP